MATVKLHKQNNKNQFHQFKGYGHTTNCVFRPEQVGDKINSLLLQGKHAAVAG